MPQFITPRYHHSHGECGLLFHTGLPRLAARPRQKESDTPQVQGNAALLRVGNIRGNAHAGMMSICFFLEQGWFAHECEVESPQDHLAGALTKAAQKQKPFLTSVEELPSRRMGLTFIGQDLAAGFRGILPARLGAS